MSKSFPYAPFYFGDFLRSTAGWTLLERGAYMMLLFTQWELGPLPNDPARLATIVGLSQSEMANIWPLLSRKFKQAKGGFVNLRMEAHRRNYLEYRKHQADSGRKGANVRWKKVGKVVQFPTQEGRRD